VKSKLLSFWYQVPSILRNPFVITVLVYGTWMVFFDENNAIEQYKRSAALDALLEKKAFYVTEVAKTKQQYSELSTNAETQEKYARERYWMKKENEDVFVMIEKPKPAKEPSWWQQLLQKFS
jgi:cell division protein FtsB